MPNANINRVLIVVLASIAQAFILSPISAQMISPTTPPASVNPTITTPPSTAHCATGPTGQPSPCALMPAPQPVPPTISLTEPSGGSGPVGSSASENDAKVLSYFQRGANRIDTNKAFGFVLLPKSAITDREQAIQLQFCKIMLASLDFMTPGEATRQSVLATYWPLIASAEPEDIETAFADKNCPSLIDWYDHSLARAIASKAGVLGMSGPMLITWPSQSALYRNPRDPLIVDFANADYVSASKALHHWFKQVAKKPELWTNHIREGTIRAELADAINDTAGVVLAVMAGKWESVTVVSETP